MSTAINYAFDYLPNFLLFFVAIGVVNFVRLKVFKKGEKIQVFREIVLVAFLAYSLMLIDITLMDNITTYLKKPIRGVNFIPFSRVNLSAEKEIGFMEFQLIANVFMFVPFGLLLPLLLKKRRFLLTVAISLAVIVSIELVQLAIGRVFDIDDIMTNFFGALIGVTCTAIVLGIIHLIKKKKSVS